MVVATFGGIYAERKSGADLARGPRPFSGPDASYKAVPGRPTPRGAHKSGREDPNNRGLKASWAHPYWRGRVRWLTAGARREGGSPRSPLRPAPRGPPPRASGSPKGRMRGRQGRGAGALAPLQGAHCAERAGWPPPSRARPVGPVRRPRVLETRRVFDARGRPGLKASHAARRHQRALFDTHAPRRGGTATTHPPEHRPPRRAQREGGERCGPEGYSVFEYPCVLPAASRRALHKPSYPCIGTDN